jgi:glucose-1-phosphate cytidylyltransferase
MKVAILAGGVGTRLAEETVVKPKPMVEVGGMPILWHIMQIYSHYGHNEFAVALGYRGEYIKKFFVDFCSLQSNLTVDLSNSKVHRHGSELPN